MKPFSESLIYDIYNDRDDEIILQVTIGHGQLAKTLIKLGNDILGEEDNSFTKNLGSSRNLVKKFLYLFIVVSDINSDNNKIEINLRLSGGKKLLERNIVNTEVEEMTSCSGIAQIFFY